MLMVDYLTLDQLVLHQLPRPSGGQAIATTVLHLRRPVSFDADAVAFCDSAQTHPLLHTALAYSLDR